MSALNRIKGLVLHEMKGSDVELKKAITRIINCIDSDLDIAGYVTSTETDMALENLDNVLIELDEKESPPIVDKDVSIGTINPRDLDLNDVEDSTKE